MRLGRSRACMQWNAKVLRFRDRSSTSRDCFNTLDNTRGRNDSAATTTATAYYRDRRVTHTIQSLCVHRRFRPAPVRTSTAQRLAVRPFQYNSTMPRSALSFCLSAVSSCVRQVGRQRLQLHMWRGERPARQLRPQVCLNSCTNSD